MKIRLSKDRFSVSLVILLSFFHPPFFAQETFSPGESDSLQQSLYETALLQVENLVLKQALHDSLLLELLEDASSLAEQNEWREGTEILNAILELYESSANPANPGDDFLTEDPGSEIPNNVAGIPPLPAVDASPRVQIEAGVDYALQEFEVSFFESDSVLVEELQNPYLSISYFQPFQIGREQSLQLNHRLRLDNQYLNYSLFGTWERKTARRYTRLEFDGNYFHSQLAEETHFLDGRVLLSYGNLNNPQNRWYVRGRGRYKGYLQPDYLYQNIFSASLNAYFEHFFNYRHSLYFSWTPSIYRETAQSGYRYVQNRLEAMYRVWGSYNRYLNAGVEGIYQDFRNDAGDELYQNSYFSLAPRLESEWAFTSRLGYEIRFSWEKRVYETADAISPDYNYLNVLAIQKFYFGDLKSLGIGYAGENQQHSVDRRSDRLLVQQADFYSHGLVFTAEYLNLQGTIVNLEYRANWRTYPNAVTSIFDSFYSDRFVHSISLFGWIPLTAHWQIQMFANYDNDQDRNDERNDNRNTIVNLAVIYKF